MQIKKFITGSFAHPTFFFFFLLLIVDEKWFACCAHSSLLQLLSCLVFGGGGNFLFFLFTYYGVEVWHRGSLLVNCFFADVSRVYFSCWAFWGYSLTCCNLQVTHVLYANASVTRRDR